MSTFLSVRALIEEGVPKKTIARRLGIDRRTVRRYAGCLASGAYEPRRARVPGKLDGHASRLEELARKGLTAVQVYQDLRGEGVEVSYPTVRRVVRTLRRTERRCTAGCGTSRAKRARWTSATSAGSSSTASSAGCTSSC